MQLILLQDVENVGLRGDVVDVARRYARNYLLPRRLAEEAPSRLAEHAKRDSHRARHEAATTDQAREILAVLEQAEAALRDEGGADRLAVRLGDGDEHRRRALGAAQGPRRPPQDRAAAADQARRTLRSTGGIFEDVQAEVATLVVPEGGELPPEPEPATEEPVAEEATAEVAVDEESPTSRRTTLGGLDRGLGRSGQDEPVPAASSLPHLL